VGRVRLKTAEPIFYDHYQTNKTMGSFIIIDEFTGQTAGAGIIWRNIQKADFLDNIK
jgi:sulfate adenylyltransferase subunit 1 (EFTu-like GTPase family)